MLTNKERQIDKTNERKVRRTDRTKQQYDIKVIIVKTKDVPTFLYDFLYKIILLIFRPKLITLVTEVNDRVTK